MMGNDDNTTISKRPEHNNEHNIIKYLLRKRLGKIYFQKSKNLLC